MEKDEIQKALDVWLFPYVRSIHIDEASRSTDVDVLAVRKSRHALFTNAKSSCKVRYKTKPHNICA